MLFLTIIFDLTIMEFCVFTTNVFECIKHFELLSFIYLETFISIPNPKIIQANPILTHYYIPVTLSSKHKL